MMTATFTFHSFYCNECGEIPLQLDLSPSDTILNIIGPGVTMCKSCEDKVRGYIKLLEEPLEIKVGQFIMDIMTGDKYKVATIEDNNICCINTNTNNIRRCSVNVINQIILYHNEIQRRYSLCDADDDVSEMNMVEISCREFQETGLLLLINTILHAFGWAISVDIKNNIMVPNRTKYRGFSPKSIDASYKKISKYLLNNVAKLYDEAMH